MTEFSDFTNTYIILGMFIGFYIYLLYLKLNIISENDWADIQCTPLYLLVGALTGKSKDSVFQKCIKKNTKKEMQKRHIQSMKNNEETVNTDTKRMESLLNSNDTSIQNKQQELIRLVDESNDNIGSVITKQNQINNAIMNTSTPIKSAMNKIELAVDKAKNIYTEFNGKL